MQTQKKGQHSAPAAQRDLISRDGCCVLSANLVSRCRALVLCGRALWAVQVSERCRAFSSKVLPSAMMVVLYIVVVRRARVRVCAFRVCRGDRVVFLRD